MTYPTAACLRIASLMLFASLTGCANGPARTAGTGNLPPEELALVHIVQHGDLTAWKGQPIHIESFYIGDAQYAVTADKDFYVPAGTQTFTIDYGPCDHGWAKVEAPFNADTSVFEGPYGRWEATLEAGRAYVISGSAKLIGRNAVQTEHRFQPVEPAPKAE